MKTILLKENIPAQSCKNVTHYEIVEHNNKKFLIYVEGSNGDILGFNTKCCLKVMNESGSWERVVDNHHLGFSAHNDDMYYGHNVEVKKKYVDMNVKEFKEYILIVFNYGKMATMEKVANYKNVLVNVNKTIDNLYISLREFIKEHGGLINTSADKYPWNIKSIEFVSGGEIAEWNVLAVSVEGDRIKYCADYDACEEVSNEDLEDYEWFDLYEDDHYYVQTLLNICEYIELYV